jgi:hypothetical protein
MGVVGAEMAGAVEVKMADGDGGRGGEGRPRRHSATGGREARGWTTAARPAGAAQSSQPDLAEAARGRRDARGRRLEVAVVNGW